MLYLAHIFNFMWLSFVYKGGGFTFVGQTKSGPGRTRNVFTATLAISNSVQNYPSEFSFILLIGTNTSRDFFIWCVFSLSLHCEISHNLKNHRTGGSVADLLLLLIHSLPLTVTITGLLVAVLCCCVLWCCSPMKYRSQWWSVVHINQDRLRRYICS